MRWLSAFKRWNAKALSGFSSVGTSLMGFLAPIMEAFTGAWQRGIRYDSKETLLRNSAVYACTTGIASDVAKMRIKLCKNEAGIWTEITENQPWLTVLRRPNHYQNRIQFILQWILSKLLHGNAYVLKERDKRGIVSALYVLDPHKVMPLVTPEGDVYYQLNPDPLSRLSASTIVVPASEIIHDMMPALWHPLVGVPPLYACACSGTLATKIQQQSIHFFGNRAIPGGMLVAPGTITKDTADRLKKEFEDNYSGSNVGRMVALGDGLEFKPIQMQADQAQLAEQFKLAVEDIARAFHYPLFKLGGPVPTLAGNVESLITTYYTDCLQALIESLELCLDEGLALPAGTGVELDLENLMRMDTAALYEANNKAVSGGWMAPDEARFRTNYKPVVGGSTPYLQQQNYSLAALAKRDARPDPFSSKETPPPAPKSLSEEELEILYDGEFRKELAA